MNFKVHLLYQNTELLKKDLTGSSSIASRISHPHRRCMISSGANRVQHKKHDKGYIKTQQSKVSKELSKWICIDLAIRKQWGNSWLGYGGRGGWIAFDQSAHRLEISTNPPACRTREGHKGRVRLEEVLKARLVWQGYLRRLWGIVLYSMALSFLTESAESSLRFPESKNLKIWHWFEICMALCFCVFVLPNPFPFPYHFR